MNAVARTRLADGAQVSHGVMCKKTSRAGKRMKPLDLENERGCCVDEGVERTGMKRRDWGR